MIVEGILLDVVVSRVEGCVLFDKAVNIVVVDVIKLIDAEEVVITKGTGGRDSDDLAAAEDVVERRTRIPFDFQRTSLVGLALDSATSSGLGRAPRSAMQDPIQAPPGATRQADRAARTCWLGCPGLLYYLAA
ncbi:hypothetical protein TNCV_1919981 [Trichonephila clavipes]|nr:hypothetical protein TNCV_1919981 [Trichonephila clavipes]